MLSACIAIKIARPFHSLAKLRGDKIQSMLQTVLAEYLERNRFWRHWPEAANRPAGRLSACRPANTQKAAIDASPVSAVGHGESGRFSGRQS
jgi:hypothetical protein